MRIERLESESQSLCLSVLILFSSEDTLARDTKRVVMKISIASLGNMLFRRAVSMRVTFGQ